LFFNTDLTHVYQCVTGSADQISVVRVFPWSSGPSLLELPKLDWDGYQQYTYYDGTVRCLRLSDGDLLYYKDNTEPLKKLEPHEIEAIKKEELKQRYTTLVVLSSFALLYVLPFSSSNNLKLSLFVSTL
jgi:hypothetical protein